MGLVLKKMKLDLLKIRCVMSFFCISLLKIVCVFYETYVGLYVLFYAA
jgi:hypothetical protein